MASTKNRKFSGFQKNFSYCLADALVQGNVSDVFSSGIPLRALVCESLSRNVSRSTLTRQVAATATDPYFCARMNFHRIKRIWHVGLKNCDKNLAWANCIRDRIRKKQLAIQQLSHAKTRKLISGMNYAYSELATEEKRKNPRFDPRKNGIFLSKIIQCAAEKEGLTLLPYSQRKLKNIFRRNCAKRYCFTTKGVILPMSESKRARAIMWAAKKPGTDPSSNAIDIGLFNIMKGKFVTAAKYVYANLTGFFNPYYTPVPVVSVLNKMLREYNINLSPRQKCRWVNWIITDKYLSIFFNFSKECIRNRKCNYRSFRHVLRINSNQFKMKTSIFILNKRFSQAREAHEAEKVSAKTALNNSLHLWNNDIFSGIPASKKMSLGANNLVGSPEGPPGQWENQLDDGRYETFPGTPKGGSSTGPLEFCDRKRAEELEILVAKFKRIPLDPALEEHLNQLDQKTRADWEVLEEFKMRLLGNEYIPYRQTT
jgi:hypothetical protein